MKKVFSALFALIAIAVAVFTVNVCFTYYDADPILLSPPEDAVSQVVGMMDTVCEGNLEGAGQYILGTPSLGADREAADDVGALLWSTYTESLSYELVGDCYVTAAGLAQEVSFTSLDISSVTENLRDRSQALLEKRVDEAEDTSEIYDENYEYREDFVMEVLYDAAVEAVKKDAKTNTVFITINLSYQDGQWWIVSDNELLDAISGGVLY